MSIRTSFYHRPNAAVRNKEYESESSDESETANVPSDEGRVEWIIFDRKNVGQRRFFKIREPPLVTGLWSSDGYVVGQLCGKRENAERLSARRSYAEDRDRIVVIGRAAGWLAIRSETKIRLKIGKLDLGAVRQRGSSISRDLKLDRVAAALRRYVQCNRTCGAHCDGLCLKETIAAIAPR